MAAAPKAKTGNPAPSFQLQSLNGKKVLLDDFKGKVVLLDFWATWCPPCRVSTPYLVQLNQRYQGKDLAILAISLDDSREPVLPFIKKEKVRHLVLYGDEAIQRDYQIRSIPTFFLIDKKGLIHRRYDGFHPALGSEWEKEINSLLSQG
ncbi:MAG: TlpA family protein disulfide reductase [Elusimicrobia bacterium]|nr:TlpA family protein disulfide reductase [Elusimicrobiota bacterium]